MATYDVFISCKSEDYIYAEEIYDYLKNLGINVFLASRELRRLGESEYRRAISKALREAYHLIVFASNPEYIETTWVEYEWDMFVNAKLKGKKQGNILTILKDVSTDDIPMDLWKYESFTFDDYRENLIKYVETPEYIERKKKLQKKEEEERKKKKEEEAKARKRAELKTKLEVTAGEYKKSVAALQVDADIINSILLELDITHRECPICRNSVPVDKTLCPVCGWSLSPIEGLPELIYLTNDSDNRKGIYESIYKAYMQQKLDSESIAGLKELNKDLEKELKLRHEELSDLKEKANKDYNELCNANFEIKKLNDIGKRRDEELSLASKNNEKLKGEVAMYKGSLATLQKEVQQLQKELANRKTVIEELNQKIHQLDSSQKSSSKNSYSIDCSSQISDNRKYGVRITNCGNKRDQVAQILSRYFNLSTFSFKNGLLSLPYFSPLTLPKNKAEEMVSSLQKLGVYCGLVYTS